MKTDRFFQLYSHAIAVTGKDRGAIYDLHKGTITPVPKSLCSILAELHRHPVPSVKQKFLPETPQLLDTYLAFLQDRQLGFYTLYPEQFPPLDLTWDSPYVIQTAVIEYEFAHYSLPRVFDQLDSLLCSHLQVGFHLTTETLEAFQQSLHVLQGKVFRSVDVVINYHPGLFENNLLENLYHSCPKINYILVDQAPWIQKKVSQLPIAFTTENIRQIRPRRRYVVNVKHFTEAQLHNTYYNRRVCIDAQGNVKNCLLLQPSYGNIQHTSLESIVQRSDFQSLWFACPDKISDICQSELRYAAYLCEALAWDQDSSMFHMQPDITPSCLSELAA